MARKTYGRLTSGFPELDKKLKELKTGLNNTIVRKGQRAQCKILAQAIKNAAPNKVTKQSIGFRVGFDKRGNQHVAKAGINVGKKPLGKGAWEKLKRIYGSTGEKYFTWNKSGAASKTKTMGASQIPIGIANPIAPLFVIGTAARYRHKSKSLLGRIRQKISGSGSTGRMKPNASFVKSAAGSARTAAQQAMEYVITMELKKIWDKQ